MAHNNSLTSPMVRRKRRIFGEKKPVLSHDLENNLSGRISESIAHFLGTPAFIFWLTIFCAVWLAWNTMAPDYLRFDSADFGFTALTLVLSLQASYAAPLILLASNRQTVRDKIYMEHDRQVSERNLADTEFLTREIESIRLALTEVATRDYIRQELRSILEEMQDSTPENTDRKEVDDIKTSSSN